MRAVLDPNVIISAVLSPGGSPAAVLRAWVDGAYELTVSPLLLTQLERALAYSKLRKRILADEANELVALLRAEGVPRPDPTTPPPVRSSDPGDDYLIALAAVAHAVLVSGDAHLLELRESIPAYSPAEFLVLLNAEERR